MQEFSGCRMGTSVTTRSRAAWLVAMTEGTDRSSTASIGYDLLSRTKGDNALNNKTEGLEEKRKGGKLY